MKFSRVCHHRKNFGPHGVIRRIVGRLTITMVVIAVCFSLDDDCPPAEPLDSPAIDWPARDQMPLGRLRATSSPTQSRIAGARGAVIADKWVRACQALGPAAPYDIHGVDCAAGDCESNWKAMGPIDWQAFAQGEYVGHARTPHVDEYRLRVDDIVVFLYRLTRQETAQPYRLNVGDEVRVESFNDEKLNRDLIVQPDGTITLQLLGQVHAARLTVEQLRQHVQARYERFYKNPEITVTPLRVNTRLEDLRATVDSRAGEGGQRFQTQVTPAGTVQLPAIGRVLVQGLTLEELKDEIDQRYADTIEGIEVMPVLQQRAARYVYVLGEVATPGRFVLEGPTTVMQSLALAGSWNVGANLRQVVVFRRGDDWRLMATMLDVQGALYGKRPCPADEIWLNDSDIVVVPKNPVKVANEFIEQVFTRGIYGVVPVQGISINFAKLSSL